jgi:hypothetical protein
MWMAYQDRIQSGVALGDEMEGKQKLCAVWDPSNFRSYFFSYDLAKFTWVSEGCIKVGQIHKTSWTIGCNKYNLKLFAIFLRIT